MEGNDVQAFLGAELFESTSEKWEKERYWQGYQTWAGNKDNSQETLYFDATTWGSKYGRILSEKIGHVGTKSKWFFCGKYSVSHVLWIILHLYFYCLVKVIVGWNYESHYRKIFKDIERKKKLWEVLFENGNKYCWWINSWNDERQNWKCLKIFWD